VRLKGYDDEKEAERLKALEDKGEYDKLISESNSQVESLKTFKGKYETRVKADWQKVSENITPEVMESGVFKLNAESLEDIEYNLSEHAKLEKAGLLNKNKEITRIRKAREEIKKVDNSKLSQKERLRNILKQ